MAGSFLFNLGTPILIRKTHFVDKIRFHNLYVIILAYIDSACLFLMMFGGLPRNSRL
jgi:hypothetical protein